MEQTDCPPNVERLALQQSPIMIITFNYNYHQKILFVFQILKSAFPKKQANTKYHYHGLLSRFLRLVHIFFTLPNVSKIIRFFYVSMNVENTKVVIPLIFFELGKSDYYLSG